MARMVEVGSKTTFTPGSSCLVGRSDACQLVLARAWVSGQHATIRWTGSQWELRDLGSKNGTYVQGRRIDPGRPVVLAEGTMVSFGRSDDPWLVESVEEPGAAAWHGGTRIEAEDDLLALPSSDDPQVCVYRTELGAWVAETPDGIRQVRDGEFLDTGGQTFRLDLPTVLAATRDMRVASLAVSTLHFHVSRDLEHIEVRVDGPKALRLPHRAHLELLLLLAEARLDDGTAGDLPETEHGWRYQDDVAHQLRIPLSHFNMTIYRARQQFRKAGFDDADALLERRRGSGQIRIGIGALGVHRA